MKKDQVYFIECSGRIKIGFSTDVQSRLRSFSTGSALKFSLVAAIDGPRQLEKAIHKLLAEHRQHGEWFEDCPAVRETIAALLAEGHAAIGFVQQSAPAKSTSLREAHLRHVPHVQDTPLRPAMIRIEACMQRHLGEFAIHSMAERRAVADRAFPLMHDALQSIGALVDALPDRRATGELITVDEVLPEAAVIAGILEREMEALFASVGNRNKG